MHPKSVSIRCFFVSVDFSKQETLKKKNERVLAKSPKREPSGYFHHFFVHHFLRSFFFVMFMAC